MGSGNTTPVRQFSSESPSVSAVLESPHHRAKARCGAVEEVQGASTPGLVPAWTEVEGRSNRTLLPPIQRTRPRSN